MQWKGARQTIARRFAKRRRVRHRLRSSAAPPIVGTKLPLAFEGKPAMSISPFLCDDEPFTPEDLQAMGTAFDQACAALGLTDKDRVTRLIADHIIELAQWGLRDPEQLYVSVMREFHRATTNVASVRVAR